MPSERWHEVRVAPVSTAADPGKRLFVITFRDLTEARRMDRMRTDFVANASHELRTPLASLMGFIETMQGLGTQRRSRSQPVFRHHAGTGATHGAPDRRSAVAVAARDARPCRP
ncbi:hypothetical protein OEG86_06595 [Hoeflea alexandrii]|uniref:histidine kinase dimerization/phospho-acceptor domain-containing protein n=1 Tax=Hoeflea alexandrii TaxID=288436 RepID=UPI00226E04F1|nr:histidine kinase dimerization/phospho-acceptor domain-containing protein [Hoeflea alexandrii]MCY0151972.1 hypothetical protein [Hoeflea alexandrii]